MLYIICFVNLLENIDGVLQYFANRLMGQFFHRNSYDINLEILSKLGAFHLRKEQQQKIIIVLLPDVVVYTIHL